MAQRSRYLRDTGMPISQLLRYAAWTRRRGERCPTAWPVGRARGPVTEHIATSTAARADTQKIAGIAPRRNGRCRTATSADLRLTVDRRSSTAVAGRVRKAHSPPILMLWPDLSKWQPYLKSASTGHAGQLTDEYEHYL